MLGKSLHELTDALGSHHDLAELLKWLEQHKWPHTTAEQAEKLRSSIQTRQKKKQELALALARLIYAEKTKYFAKRQRQYWEAS